MKKIISLVRLVSCVIIAGVGYAASDLRPNVVLFLADDVGLGDLSALQVRLTGNSPLVITPELDGLVADALWFQDGHSPTSLCSPTRYAIMSGNYNVRCHAPWGVWNTFARSPFREGEKTLGHLFQARGYETAFIGKWHLGGDFEAANRKEIFRGKDHGLDPSKVHLKEWVGGGPPQLGFDYDFTLPCGIQGPLYLAYEKGKWYPLGSGSEIVYLSDENVLNPEFLTSKGAGPGDSEWDPSSIHLLLHQKAAAFIRAYAGRQPFFLYYCSPLVHKPHTPPATLNGAPLAGTQPSRHLEMLKVLDWEVGELIRVLKETGQYDNTVFIFTSDNGGLHVPESHVAGHRTSGSYSGAKNSPLEGGHRVPFLVRWPGVTDGRKEVDTLASSMDFFATFAEYLKVPLNENEAMDSVSLMPLLTGQQEHIREELLLQAGSQTEVMIRWKDHKLIMQSDWGRTYFKPTALFNLRENPQEVKGRNLLSDPESSEMILRMQQRYQDVSHASSP